jgi:hypothetical protein
MSRSLTLTILAEVELTLTNTDSITSAFRGYLFPYQKQEAADGLYLFHVKFVAFSMMKKSSVYTDYLLSKEGARIGFIIFPKTKQEVIDDETS